ncbi:MAG: hypothetical protein AAB588_02870 [Patescibacteria group bacterium]
MIYKHVKNGVVALAVFASFFLGSMTVFADANVSLFMTTWQKFAQNEASPVLPNILITDAGGGNITPAKGVTIMLPTDIDILWDKTVTQYAVNDALVTVTYSKNLRNVTIPVTATFTAGQSVIVSGAKLRIYSPGSSYRDLKLDINGDGVADATGVNGVQIDADVLKSDQQAPFQVANVSHAVSEKSVTLTWENPVDPDYNGLFITKTLTRGGKTTPEDIAIDKLTTTYSDANVQKDDVLEYSLKTKDNVGNVGEGVKVTLTFGATLPPPVLTPPPVVTPPAPPAEETPPSPAPVVMPSITDSLSESEITSLLAAFKDIDANTPNRKQIAYLVKIGALKGDKAGRLRLDAKMSYAAFAQIVVKAFAVEGKGTALTIMKKLGYILKATKASRFIPKKNALKILLKVKGIDAATQNITDMKLLRGTLLKGDLVPWMIAVVDAP